jgi:hypothetical protein
MKQVLLVIVVAIALTACKKTVIQPGLFGKWELRNEVGGIAGIDSNYSAGNGTALQFSSDSTYKHYIKGKLNDQGTFHISSSNSPSGNSVVQIFFNGNTSGQLFVFSGIQLTIGEDFDDGIAATYQKISD